MRDDTTTSTESAAAAFEQDRYDHDDRPDPSEYADLARPSVNWDSRPRNPCECTPRIECYHCADQRLLLSERHAS